MKESNLKINGQFIPIVKEVKYLGMSPDIKLEWEEHIKKKQNELEIIRRRYLAWLTGRRSK